MEIFFSFFLFPIFDSPSAREILRKQKELEKYFSYCTLHRAITSTYYIEEFLKVNELNLEQSVLRRTQNIVNTS